MGMSQHEPLFSGNEARRGLLVTRCYLGTHRGSTRVTLDHTATLMKAAPLSANNPNKMKQVKKKTLVQR